ncbi:cytochrome P450 [Nocardia stercoris]|uniref:Cytochrome P450 n=1 Tax=Nocardia stercoris TaxID=2483361 RepID=A0A3M2LBH2_9NOCA|nr:cytochrome P450 [Nocardia stercoris]RMI34070.1 cytochrome P450 [Nocardia stercoris]
MQPESPRASDSGHPRPRAPRAVLLHALWAGIDFESYFRHRRAHDGDPFLVRFPGFGGALFTGTASGTKELFRAPVELLRPPEPNPIEPLVGSASLILARDAVHRRDRRLLAPAFHRSRITLYGHTVHESTVAELTGAGAGPAWTPGARIDVRAAARAITLRVILRAVFGIDDPGRRAVYTAAVVEFLSAFGGPLMLVPLLRHSVFGHGPWARFAAARDRLDELLTADLQRRRSETAGAGADIMGLLLAARYTDGGGCTDAELLDQLRTLLVAGHETTATSLVWALYHLHRTPAALRRLRAELAAVGPDPDPEDLARLPYLDAVCHETLRLHPPVPIVLRRLTGPFTLLGVDLAAGDTMGVALPLLHSDPETWSDPYTFTPERFLDRGYGPFEFAPYGGGHRRCVGSTLAEYELRIALATIVSRVELALTPRYAGGRQPRAVPHNIATGPHAGITVDVVRAVAP